MTSPKLRDRVHDARMRSQLLSAPWWFYLLAFGVFSIVGLGWHELFHHHYAVGSAALGSMALLGLGGVARRRWRRRRP